MLLAETIFKKIDLNIPIIHATRLGKNSAKPRSIMVKLGSKTKMLSVLKAKRKLREIDSFKQIFIGMDLTITQRTQYNEALRQLDAKNTGG